MKLEDQVTNLELSKKLKELGVKQESYASWCRDLTYGDSKVHGKRAIEMEYWAVPNDLRPEDMAYEIICSAFTASELGEMLPEEILKENMVYELHINKEKEFDTYWCNYSRIANNELLGYGKKGKSLAGCMAKMLIYLIENKLIKI